MSGCPVLPYQPDPLGHVRTFSEQHGLSVWMSGIGFVEEALGLWECWKCFAWQTLLRERGGVLLDCGLWVALFWIRLREGLGIT